MFQDSRDSIIKALKHSLLEFEIDEEEVLDFWGVDTDTQNEFLGKLGSQILEMEKKAIHDPIYGRMKDLLIQQLDNSVKLYYQQPATLFEGIAPQPFVRTDEPHRRVLSESMATTSKPNLAFLPNLKIEKKHKRSNSVISFESLQSKFRSFLKKGSLSDASPLSPASTDSPFSPLSPDTLAALKPKDEAKINVKKGMGIKKIFKTLMGKKSTESPGLPNPNKLPDRSADIETSVDVPTEVVDENKYTLEEEVQESPDISGVSPQVSEIDYSNPYRNVVYELKEKIAEKKEEESEIMVESEFSEDLDSEKSVGPPKKTAKMDNVIIEEAFDDFDEESELNIEDIRGTKKLTDSDMTSNHDLKGMQISITEPIRESTPNATHDMMISNFDDLTSASIEDSVKKPSSLPSKKSDDSFNFSDLSDISELGKSQMEPNPKTIIVK